MDVKKLVIVVFQAPALSERPWLGGGGSKLELQLDVGESSSPDPGNMGS
jgi:hypothetical protein